MPSGSRTVATATGQANRKVTLEVSIAMIKNRAHPYDFDVIIVGSGVAGALAAWKLSTYDDDYRILILEAGDNGIGEGQRAEFHHAMDRQGNRGDMFAPYLEIPRRLMVPSPEKAAAPK